MRYRGTTRLKDRENKNTILANIQYPEIPKENGDLYIYATEQDRYDTLADKYYNDQSMWYILALANIDINPNPASLYPPLGARIRIPANFELYAARFEAFRNLPMFVLKTNKFTELETGYTQIKLY